ncbi:MAG: hypothetical protein ACYCUM_08355 [Solirubrobacteraceae bacterium]
MGRLSANARTRGVPAARRARHSAAQRGTARRARHSETGTAGGVRRATGGHGGRRLAGGHGGRRVAGGGRRAQLSQTCPGSPQGQRQAVEHLA